MDDQLPNIYTFKYFDENDKIKPNIVIIAGTHGNEIGPSLFLMDLIKNFENIKKNLIKGHYYIVPFVNPLACSKGVRMAPGQPDINRSWPDGHKINKFLLPIMDNADFIIDIHEALGFNNCQHESLGQTLYTNSTFLLARLFRLQNELNLLATDEDVKKYVNEKCFKWNILKDIPDLPNTLLKYVNKIKKTYVLIEIAGQNEILPIDVKFKILNVCVSFLLGC